MFIERKNLIVNKKRGLIKKALFSHILKIKNEILKQNYALSVNFISEATAKKLNQDFRKKNYIPNILSFPLSKNEGEIFLCLSVIKKENKDFNLSYNHFLTLLLIHGCLHLKGHKHNLKMEKLEEKIFKKYMLK